MPRSQKMFFKITFVILALGLMAIVCGGGFLAYTIFWPINNNAQSGEYTTIKIKQGSSFVSIATMLADSGVVRNRKGFVFTAKLLGKSNQVKAGKYRLLRRSSNYQALKIIHEGKQAAEWVTIPEGLTARQIAGILQKRLEIDSLTFIKLVQDSSVAKEFDISANSLEGYLYPDTYRFTWGLGEKNILAGMIKQFKVKMTDSLTARASEIGLTLNQVLTLASIIEGEAMVDSERQFISAVYHNRLKRGMLLQADPTVQYIISDGPRRLLNKDLEIDSPYNTYIYPGLPPGPISNPGIESITAALFPANVDYLYFVAKGDGGHEFNSSLRGHLIAKRNFDKVRSKVAKQQRARTQHAGS